MNPQPRWSTPDDVVAAARRRWRDGSLLRAYLQGEKWPGLEIPLRGPSTGQVAQSWDQVRRWAAAHDAAEARDRYDVRRRAIGGRVVGANLLPARAVLDGYEAAFRLLGEWGRTQELAESAERMDAHVPALAAWMRREPLRVLDTPDWPHVAGAALWLSKAAGRGMFLRQIDVPGVDTKFVEGHRAIIAALLEELLPPEAIDGGVPRVDLERRYGFRRKPDRIRLRDLDPDDAHLAGELSELTCVVRELPGALIAELERLLIVENEVTFLALPPIHRCVAVLGSGYDVTRLAALGANPAGQPPHIVYWGDLDTHGFAILNRVRTHVPTARSALMTREVLLSHRDQWAREPRPTASALPLLTAEEQEVYRELVQGTHGSAVRLEQERIRYGLVLDALGREFETTF